MTVPRFSYVIFGYDNRPWVYSKYPFDYHDFNFTTTHDGVGVLTYVLPMEINCRQQDLLGQPLFPYPRFDNNISSFSFILKACHRFIWSNGRWVALEHELHFNYDSSISIYRPIFEHLLRHVDIFDIPGFSAKRVPTRVVLEQF